jgi:hypothetical protein
LPRSESLNIENLMAAPGFTKACKFRLTSFLVKRAISLVCLTVLETYLVDQAGLNSEQNHEDADKVNVLPGDYSSSDPI